MDLATHLPPRRFVFAFNRPNDLLVNIFRVDWIKLSARSSDEIEVIKFRAALRDNAETK